MANTLLLTAPEHSGPMLETVFKTLGRGDPVKEDRFYQYGAGFLMAYDIAVAKGGTIDWKQVIQDGRDSRFETDRALEGHSFPGDKWDNLSTGLTAADWIGKGLLAGGALSADVPAAIAGGVLTEGADFIKDAMGTPLAQAFIARGRYREGVDATYNMIAYVSENKGRIAQRLAECSLNADCARAAAKVIPEVAGAAQAMPAKPGDIANAHPTIYNVTIRQGIQSDKTIRLDIAKLKTSVEQDFTEIKATVNEGFTAVKGALTQINTELGSLEAGQDTILDWINAQNVKQEQQEKQAKAAQIAAEARRVADLRWEAAASALGAVTAVTSLFDKKLSSDIARVGGASLQILRAGSQMMDAVSALSAGLTAATALGSAAATGNFIGAAVQLISIFGPAGPTPEQMIMDQIGALRDQIDSFHKDVDARFDRVDHELNVIYDGVMTELGHIELEQRRISDTLDNITARLGNLSARLDGLQTQLIAYFQTLDRAPLRVKADDALTRRARNLPMPEADFASFQSFFHEFAAPGGEAWSAIEQPAVGRSTADEDLAGQLGAHLQTTGGGTPPVLTPEDNLSYIKAALVDRGLTLDDGSPVPNPDLPNPWSWSIAAYAFAHLQAQYPELVAAADPGQTQRWQQQASAGGERINSYLEALRNSSAVFAALLVDYQNAVRHLGEAMDTRAAEVRRNQATARGHGSPPDSVRDPWMAPDAPFAWRPPQLARMRPWRSDLGLPELDAPAALAARVPQLFLTADWLNANGGADADLNFRLDCVYTLRWNKVIVQPRPTPKNPDPEPYEAGQLDMSLGAYAEGAPVAKIGALGTTEAGSGTDKDFGPAVTIEWAPGGYLRKRIDIPNPPAASLDANEQALLGLATGDVGNLLFSQQLALRGEIVRDLGEQCAAGGKLEVQARAVDGLRALIDALIRLVFEQAASNDDVLVALLDGAPAASGGVRLPDAAGIRAGLAQTVSAPTVSADGTFATAVAELIATPWLLLSNRLAAWQGQIGHGYTEYRPLADDALALLSGSNTVIELTRRAAHPPDPQEDFLSQLPTVKQGDSGPPARRVQALLRAATPTLTDKTLSIDGKFGPASASALKTFQKQSGLTASGSVDDPTWRKLLGV